MEQGTDKGSIRDLVFVTLIGILFSRFSLGSMTELADLLLETGALSAHLLISEATCSLIGHCIFLVMHLNLLL